MDIFKTVSALNLPRGEYAVVGSGILAAKGIRRADDVDLVMTLDLMKRLLVEGWKTNPTAFAITGREFMSITNGSVEAFSDMKRGTYMTDTIDIIRSAEVIKGIPFMNFEETKAFKAALGRPKDTTDIQLIDEYLKKVV